jgi:small subunit ribosomal protein S21
MIGITLQDGDRIDWALKAFRRIVLRAGVLREVRRRRYYVKPSAARQLKSEAAQRRGRSKKRPGR